MGFEQQELAKFTQAGRAISDAVGASFEKWAMGEMGVVLREWTSHIPETTPAAARLRSRGRATKEIGVHSLKAWSTTVNTGRKGGKVGLAWFRTRRGKFQPVGVISDEGEFDASHLHYKSQDAMKISMALNSYAGLLPRVIEAGQQAIGLARNSVIQIADSLGIALEQVRGHGSIDFSRARAARPSNGQFYQNGYGIKAGKDDNFSVEAVNTYSRIAESKVDVALDEVLSNRFAYHMQNLQAALAKDARAIASAYPYVSVT